MKKTQRRCPLCAEVVKPEATKCRSCGSTLGKDWSVAAKDEPAPVEALDAGPPPPGPAEVGPAGVGVLLGALLGYALGAWLDPAVHPVLVIVGAAAGGAVVTALRRGA